MQDLLPFITHFRSAYNFSNASTVAATFLWTFLSCTTRKPVWKFRKQREKRLRTHTAITRASPFWGIARRNWEQVNTPIYLSPRPEPRAPSPTPWIWEDEKTPRLGRGPVSLKSWDPFLESAGNFSGPKSNIKMEIWRVRARVLASKLLHLVSLTDGFIMLDAKLLKPRSLM